MGDWKTYWLRGKGAPYLLLLPFFAFFIFFWVMPLVGGLRLSLHSNTLVEESEYVGLQHYQELREDPKFEKAIRNNIIYTGACIVVILPLSALLAYGLQSAWKKLRPALTFLLLLPGLTPPAVLALLFLLVFHGKEGLLNHLFVIPFHIRPINWLKDPHFIMPALVLQAVWRWTGFVTFFFLAGMEAIPKSLYEAAYLETNDRWKVFKRVTLPLLQPVVLFCAVYLVVDAFAMFSGAYMLLGGSGGTADAGLLMVSYIYQQAFTYGNFGTAAAMSLMVAPALLALLWLAIMGPRWLKGRVG
jgi:ABC-type sugar transport system permease subunit